MTNRREFLTALAGATVLRAQSTRASQPLPGRGEYLIRDAYVMTMDRTLGDISGGSVHIKNGAITEVGKEIKALGATILDGRRTIVMPGLIDTHWHMWTTYLRSLAGDQTNDGYFPLTTRYGQAMEPADMYRSTKLAAAEAINAGITTVGDNWVRCRWSYGPYRGIPNDKRIDLADVEAFHRDWNKYSGDGLLSLGLMWTPIPAGAAERVKVAKEEFEFCRRLTIPMCAHWASRENTPPGEVTALAQGNFLGKDLMLIHMLATSPAEMKMIAAGGSSISVSPGSELRIGYGSTKACDFMDAGINVAVSVDSVPLTGNANFFGILKLMRNAENAKSFNEFRLTARRALEMATLHGARALGLDDQIGSLAPGKRADVIMVRTDHLTMGVFTDPAHMLVEATEEADVDTVLVDGRILKRNGKLTAMNPEQVMADAALSLEAVGKRIK
jgi:5-methylthioadenosine/S-adenosylhomocysteine deaminase